MFAMDIWTTKERAGHNVSSSHLFMKLHQTLLTGVSVLFVIKVFIVVHVPAHLLLVIHRALMGTVRLMWYIHHEAECSCQSCVHLPFWELYRCTSSVDGCTWWIHWLFSPPAAEQTPQLKHWHKLNSVNHSNVCLPPWRPPGSPLHLPSPSSVWTLWSTSWWASVHVVKRSSRSEGSPPDRNRAAAPAGTDPRC